MALGRIFGWLLVVMAALTASAEAVVALGTGEYESIATVDLWTLITGHAPNQAPDQVTDWAGAIHATLLAMPAWIAIGSLGIALIFGCRSYRRRTDYQEETLRFSAN